MAMKTLTHGSAYVIRHVSSTSPHFYKRTGPVSYRSARISATMKSQRDAEAEVQSWGFKHVFTWTDRPQVFTATLQLETSAKLPNRHAHYPAHQHSGMTTHLILRGSLTYTYPDDPQPIKETLGHGNRWDVDANRRHEVWVGDQGCTYV